MYRACIFDMDGTLADTLQSIAAFGNAALEAHGLSPIPPEHYRTLVGNGADVLIRRMLTASGAGDDPGLAQRVRKHYDTLYAQAPLHLVTPYPGIPETLDTLHAAGIPMGILSNKPDDMTRAMAAGLFPGRFCIVRGQQTGFPGKPSPAALYELLQALSLSPQEVLYCGDSDVDMQLGTNAGCDTCGVLWGFRSREELVQNGARFLISHPRELLSFFRPCH